jgi:2-amino-4-hydroxy-6-hydroxymethyldihydropteridine diphosphokinase
MPFVYVGLGSNLGRPEECLKSAVKALAKLPETGLVCCSSFYRSKPVGPQDQPAYINAVAKLETNLTALELLDCLQALEDQKGRIRTAERWGPRTLDLDLLLYGDQIINEERLVVPHCEMHRRCFVLYPLFEISPEIVIPGLGPVETMLEKVNDEGLQKLAHR